MNPTDPYKHATTTTLGGSIYSYSRVAGPSSEQLDIWEHAALLYHGYSWQEAKDSFFSLAQTANDRQSYVCCILNAGLIAARLGEYKEARDYAYAAVGADVTNAFAVLLSALMDWELGDLAKAKACLDVCMRMLRSEGNVDYKSKGLDFTLRHNVVRALSGYVKDRMAENSPGKYAQTAPAIIPAECIFEAPERLGTRKKSASRMPSLDNAGNELSVQPGHERSDEDEVKRFDTPLPRSVRDDGSSNTHNRRDSDVYHRRSGGKLVRRSDRKGLDELYRTKDHRQQAASQTRLAQPREASMPFRPVNNGSKELTNSPSSTGDRRREGRPSREHALTAEPVLPDIARLSIPNAEELQKQAAREAIEKLRQIAAQNGQSSVEKGKERRKESLRSNHSSGHRGPSKAKNHLFTQKAPSSNLSDCPGFSINRTAPLPPLQKKKLHSGQGSSVRNDVRWRQRSETETIRIHAADLSRFLSSEHHGRPHLSTVSIRDSKHAHTRSTSGSAERSTKGRTLQRLKAVWRGHGDVDADPPARDGKTQPLALPAPPIVRKKKTLPRNARGSFGHPRSLANYIRETDHLAPQHLQFPIFEESSLQPVPLLEASELATFLANAARDRLCVDQEGGFSYDIAREDLLIGAPMPWANAATRANLLAVKRHSAPRRMESTMNQLSEAFGANVSHRRTSAGYAALKAQTAAPRKGFSILDHFRDDDDDTDSTSSLQMLRPEALKITKVPFPSSQLSSPEPGPRLSTLDVSQPWQTHGREPNPWAGLHTAASSSSDLFAGVNTFTERRNRAYDAALRMLEGRERMHTGAGEERKEKLIRMSKMLFTPKAEHRVPQRMPAMRRASVEDAAVIRVPTSQFFAFRG